MRPIQVYLPEEEHQELKLRAVREHTTISDIIRGAIRVDGINVGVANIPKEETPKISTPEKKLAGPAMKACSHGAHPMYCKHAKPGKPCKEK